jgi:CheY-like chemotaxis protein
VARRRRFTGDDEATKLLTAVNDSRYEDRRGREAGRPPVTFRVLIADDDATVRSLLRATLPEDGYDVLEACDGNEALQLIGQEPLDLVLLDWHMPGRRGAQVLEELKRRHPALPVVVLTAEHQAPHRARAEALGVDVFLTKPFSPIELLDTVERLLPERRPDELS